MIAALAFLFALQSIETPPIEEFSPGLFQRIEAMCEARVGDKRSEAFRECLRDDPELLAAGEACSTRYGIDQAAVVKCLGIITASDLPLDELESDISNRHPADYYTLASRLFEAGENDKGVFWFYAGQLRWRLRLDCLSSDPNGEGMQFSVANQEVGQLAYEYTSGHPEKWVETIHRVVAWDKAQPSNFDDMKDCESHVVKQRKAILGLARAVERDLKKNARLRAKNGRSDQER